MLMHEPPDELAAARVKVQAALAAKVVTDRLEEIAVVVSSEWMLRYGVTLTVVQLGALKSGFLGALCGAREVSPEATLAALAWMNRDVAG